MNVEWQRDEVGADLIERNISAAKSRWGIDLHTLRHPRCHICVELNGTDSSWHLRGGATLGPGENVTCIFSGKQSFWSTFYVLSFSFIGNTGRRDRNAVTDE